MVEVNVSDKFGYLAEAVTGCVLQKKRIKTFGKTHRKNLCKSLSLACRHETLSKKRLLHWRFPIKLIRAFSWTVWQFWPSYLILLKIFEILVHEAIWKRIAWESCSHKVFLLQMDRIFKADLLSLEWQWGLLVLNIIHIFFRNNVMKKTKIRSI